MIVFWKLCVFNVHRYNIYNTKYTIPLKPKSLLIMFTNPVSTLEKTL
jgi:hypothetical protein